MRTTSDNHKGIIAVLCSDIHLSHKAPISRSCEKDWYEVMARGLLELNHIAQRYGVPIICAGDIFDHWKSPPELINFALSYLPEMYAIPGQHDLPYHSLEDIRKSAYWTLVQANKVTTIHYKNPVKINKDLVVWGFPWNCEVHLEEDDKGPCDYEEPIGKTPVRLAAIHAYNWMQGKSYPGAPKNNAVLRWQKKLKTFDASVFGDNHKGFTFGKNMMNCGGFFRRKIDEIDYQPQIGLLSKWGHIIPHQLTYCNEDQFIDREELTKLAEKGLEMGQFVADLMKLGDNGVNFIESVKRFCDRNGISRTVQKIILEAMETEG